MTLLLSLAIAALFSAGAFLMLKRDLIRITAGTMLVSNATILLIIAARLLEGRAPIYPCSPSCRSAIHWSRRWR